MTIACTTPTNRLVVSLDIPQSDPRGGLQYSCRAMQRALSVVHVVPR